MAVTGCGGHSSKKGKTKSSGAGTLTDIVGTVKLKPDIASEPYDGNNLKEYFPNAISFAEFASYFNEVEQDVNSDENLKEMLIGVDDVNRIPLPAAAPYFTKEGLCFCYQQYEIAPYAAGMINFTIPYGKIRSFLTSEAQELIK